MMMKFAKVLLPLSLDKSYSYVSSDLDLEIGCIVQVEFCRKLIWGVVEEIENDKPNDLELNKIKPILNIHQRLKLSDNHLKFITEIASYNLANKGLVFRSFINILNSDKVKKEAISLQHKILPDKFKLKNLQPAQQQIFEAISNEINSAQTFLLDGVTGSGKTEIYFAVIAKILKKFSESAEAKNDPQILILLPEIALTSQLVMRFEEQFIFKPALWHSKISKK